MSLSDIQSRIARSAHAAGRLPSDITLIAVSKQQSDAQVDSILAAGQRVFGENRVQESLERWMPRKVLYADLSLHLIGPLQTNKVRDAVAFFDMIHTLDRPKLADALAAEMQRTGRFVPCLIQINTGNEPQKAGIDVSGLQGLLRHARDAGINVAGLMCIPPAAEDPSPHFALLRSLAQDHGLGILSMGMSSDFESAIHHGATHVRVGSALFGVRASVTR